MDAEAAGEEPHRILVTGGTGFIGRHLVRALGDRGHQVTVLGRNPEPIADLMADAGSEGGSVYFQKVDLRDRPAVVAACAGQQIVYHVGALTAPWGARREFHAVNVAGTASVIMGCRRHRVARLIHVSSPSVVFDYRDQFDLPDSAPYPRRFGSEYARTKALAEVLVRRAIARGLPAVIVRPRAVFGPGDTTLFPRLLRAAGHGRLPRIGRGENVTDLTYIDNVIHALLLAMRAPDAPGHILTITNGRPVALWPLIDRVLATQNLRTSDRRVPLPVALAAASALEWIWRLLRLPGEPAVTRYSVGLLGHSQTFDITNARQILGYAPAVPLEEGMARTLAWLQGGEETATTGGAAAQRPGDRTGQKEADGAGRVAAVAQPSVARATPMAVECAVLAAGYCRQSYRHMVSGGEDRELALPATFAVIQHPTCGVILFDTGYAPRSLAVTARWPFSLYARLLPVTIKPEWSAVAQLARRGIAAEDVRYLILSHFHADHLGGVRDFPHATILVSAEAYHRVRGRRGWRALRLAFIPDLLPDDFEARLRLLPFPQDDSDRQPGVTAAQRPSVSLRPPHRARRSPATRPQSPMAPGSATPADETLRAVSSPLRPLSVPLCLCEVFLYLTICTIGANGERTPVPLPVGEESPLPLRDAGPWSVFPRTVDLFGDGSLIALPLPGHAAGQIGLLLRTGEHDRTLLAADGCWVSTAYRRRRMPSLLTAPIQDSWAATRQTLGRLHAVWRTEPEVRIVPCHCPEEHDALLAAMDVPAALRW